MAAVSAASRLISALVINKIAALYVGPSGFAALGQFQNFTAIALNVGGHCYTNGIVQRLIDSGKEAQAVPNIVIRTVVVTILVTSIAIAILVFVMRSLIASWIFGGTLGPMILVFAGCMVPLNLHYAFLAITNGLKKPHLFAAINIAASALTVTIGAFTIPLYGLLGALFTPLAANAFAAIVGYRVLRPYLKLSGAWSLAQMDGSTSRLLIRYGMTALGAMLMGPTASIAIRTMLVARGMQMEAGYWQAITKLAEGYMLPLTMLMTMHYLPGFTRAQQDTIAFRRLIKVGASQIFGGMLVVAGGLYVCRDTVISLLLSRDFYPIRNLFLPQTMGDAFRGLTLLFQTAMLARGLMRRYLATEVVFWGLFVVALAIGLHFHRDAATVTYAYVVSAAVVAIGTSRFSYARR